MRRRLCGSLCLVLKALHEPHRVQIRHELEYVARDPALCGGQFHGLQYVPRERDREDACIRRKFRFFDAQPGQQYAAYDVIRLVKQRLDGSVIHKGLAGVHVVKVNLHPAGAHEPDYARLVVNKHAIPRRVVVGVLAELPLRIRAHLFRIPHAPRLLWPDLYGPALSHRHLPESLSKALEDRIVGLPDGDEPWHVQNFGIVYRTGLGILLAGSLDDGVAVLGAHRILY